MADFASKYAFAFDEDEDMQFIESLNHQQDQ